jgi:hypothetical protein
LGSHEEPRRTHKDATQAGERHVDAPHGVPTKGTPVHEWAEGRRRYLGLDVLARSQTVATTVTEEVSESALQALTA